MKLLQSRYTLRSVRQIFNYIPSNYQQSYACITWGISNNYHKLSNSILHYSLTQYATMANTSAPTNAAHETPTLPLMALAALSNPRFEFESDDELVAAALVLVGELEDEEEEKGVDFVGVDDARVLLLCGLAVVLAVVCMVLVVEEALPWAVDDDAALAPLPLVLLLVSTAVELEALPCVELVTMVKTPSVAVWRV